MFLSSSPGVIGFWFCLLRTLPKQLTFLLVFFRRRGEGCHFRFRAPANHLASTFLLLVSGDLRLLSTNICWYPLCDLHSFLTVTFLTGCHCSFQREDSINLISIVSVGYHMTVWRKNLTAIAPEFCELYWTSPGGSIPQRRSNTNTYHPSRKPSKLDEQDKQDTA